MLPVGHPLALPLSGKELAPDPNRLKDVFRRVRFEHAGEMSNAQLVEALGEQRQALVIVNSRKHAFDLFKAAKSHGIEDVFHLSTRQTAFDRRRILEIVRRRLAVDLPCRVVATSLIEAGVDIDFPKVWRCEAGLDQIAQAAGRCNREGLRPVEESVVTIFSSSAYPPPHEMKGMIRDMKAAVRRHGDILSPAAVSSYFQETYWRVGDEGLDGLGIMDLFKMSPEGTDFSFRSADAQFNLIGSGERSVIIADAPEAKAALLKASDASVRSLQISRLLQAHTVNVPEKVFERLLATGKVMPESPSLRDGQFMVLRDPALYDPEVGLIWD